MFLTTQYPSLKQKYYRLTSFLCYLPPTSAGCSESDLMVVMIGCCLELTLLSDRIDPGLYV